MRNSEYLLAENKIDEAFKTGLTQLDLSKLNLSSLPKSIGKLKSLEILNLSENPLIELPASVGNLSNLKKLYLNECTLATLPENFCNLLNLEVLDLSSNFLQELPENFGKIDKLKSLDLSWNGIETLPATFSNLTKLENLSVNLLPLKSLSFIRKFTSLKSLKAVGIRVESIPKWINEINLLSEIDLGYNDIRDLPIQFSKLNRLNFLNLNGNPLVGELRLAYSEGIRSLSLYLNAKGTSPSILNEAKMILVGEGEVGKSSLLAALRGDRWLDNRDTTHGIEIKPVEVRSKDGLNPITLNCWDFGGQRVYRPTHQLFFSSHAIYVVVWKPRQGPQQGFVKEWIQLILRRTPEAAVIIVATHGGPGQRQPDIERAEIKKLFKKGTPIEFHFVDSKPNENIEYRGISELKESLYNQALGIEGINREIPKSFNDVIHVLREKKEAFVSIESVYGLCQNFGMDHELAKLFVTISHRLGHLIHYEHDPILKKIVILKPNWLATAISFALDNEDIRKNNGLVRFSNLSKIWNDINREAEFRYSEDLHDKFLRLMERYDLCYKVTEISGVNELDPLVLIAQLVTENKPEQNISEIWTEHAADGEIELSRLCQITDLDDNTALASGMLYRLIVRFHHLSLGRLDYRKSIHWQHGIILENDYNGMALIEAVENDILITVRAAYPETLLAIITSEIQFLIQTFWKGLKCEILVPCILPCGKDKPGSAYFKTRSLLDYLRNGRYEVACPKCDSWQDINRLLSHNSSQSFVPSKLFKELKEIKMTLGEVNSNTKELLSKSDFAFVNLLKILTDEAKEGPRLFSLKPINTNKFNPRNWISHKFQITLWCEHSRLPLPLLNPTDQAKNGVYEIELEREWFEKFGPILKTMFNTLAISLPLSKSIGSYLDDIKDLKIFEEELEIANRLVESILNINELMQKENLYWMEKEITNKRTIEASGGTLRTLHSFLNKTDPSFGGLVRVLNNRNEFMWIHQKFVSSY